METNQLPELDYCNACHLLAHDNDIECPAYNDEFSLGDVVALLAKDGIKAEIMQTGGGNATLYLGDPNADGYYSVVCGAGVWDWDTPKNSYGFTSEFFIGRDDDRQNEGFYYKGKNDVKEIEQVIYDYFMFDKVQHFCSLCDNQITDLEAGGFFPVFGEVCGDCVTEMKKTNPNLTKEAN